MEFRFALSLLVVCCLASTATAGVKPEGYVRQWTVIGPFANPERAAGEKYGEYSEKFFTTIADSML